ncbi:arsenate reductase family protein [Aquibacillus sediminis]|uniref:arsenate reductase family protein n=1 Tax=Aquibacillus sediminis TaxID=2574734 RepID=UPI0011085C1D|nr:arsenate reductase family protein [Aquibacillus sediminis]
MTLAFYWYPKCGTCKKAKKWLDEQEISYETIHIVDNPPTIEQLQTFIEKSGLPIKKFFNTSGKKYRELGLKDKLNEATDEQKIDWLASDGMLLKRPIVTDGDHVTVGFKEEEFEQTWK